MKKIATTDGPYVVLYICGGTMPVSEKMAATGVCGLSIESAVGFYEAVWKVGGKAVMTGNVGLVRSLIGDDPGPLKADALTCARAGLGTVTPGCGV